MLRLLAEGLDNRAIAQRLDLSIKTVENHLTRLYRQLDVQSRLEAATYVREHPEIIAYSGNTAVVASTTAVSSPTTQTAILAIDDNQRYRSQLRRTIGNVYPQVMIYKAANTAEAMRLAELMTPQIAFVDVVLGWGLANVWRCWAAG
jgi:DNA-binding NarL/FixJ family response regulator